MKPPSQSFNQISVSKVTVSDYIATTIWI